MTTVLTPGAVPEVVEAVRSTRRLLAVGAGTKPRLSAVEATRLSTRRLSGVLEYEPSEFTLTALAGTPMRDLVTALAQRGQYLPFDPILLEAGATLGGTVAAGLSGPGRFRFGGLRDFILGIRFVDGAGRLLRMGGKVVKNAAGFDLPKFFVGSLGRFGVLCEVTLKAFPRPASSLTLKISVAGLEAAKELLVAASNSRWEPEALDIVPEGGGICLRLGGPLPALEALAREIFGRWPGVVLPPVEADALWSSLREWRWTHPEGPLFKIPLTPLQWPSLAEAVGTLPGARVHVSGGGQVALVSMPDATGSAALEPALRRLGLPALTLRGTAPLWGGARSPSQVAQAVKDALDPEHRFPAIED